MPDKFKRFRFSVPFADESVHEWIEKQSNLSNSLRQLIRDAIRREGMVDITCSPVVQRGSNRPERIEYPMAQPVDAQPVPVAVPVVPAQPAVPVTPVQTAPVYTAPAQPVASAPAPVPEPVQSAPVTPVAPVQPAPAPVVINLDPVPVAQPVATPAPASRPMLSDDLLSGSSGTSSPSDELSLVGRRRG